MMRFTGSVRCLLLAFLLLVIPASSFAGVVISVAIAPPALPVYEQPPCPGDGYIWTPGYWAYGPEGYYWVPGTWVMPPTVGVLWTPGYWGWGNGVYIWHAGYWGPHIGFYGGVNYGFGYFGHGYDGGYWRGRHFYYNRTVNNVRITNVHIYNKTVINNVTVNRVSYNGGHGGINARPTHEQERWSRERHFEPTHLQRDHEHGARGNREFWASENHGRPAVAATSRPGEFHGPKMVPTRSNRGPSVRENGAPRPQNSGQHADRPMPRQEMRGGRGHQSEYNAPQHRGPDRQERGRGHDNAPHQQREGHGNNGHDRH